MKLDLIVVKNEKKEKEKKIILLAIILFVIALLSLLIVYQFRNHKPVEKTNNGTIIQDENFKKKMKISREISLLPNYTDIGKNKMNNLYKSKQKTVYLTFDDGPSRTVTPLILDVLKQENIKATFFVLGSRVELYPELIKREYQEGHFIANHGYSHIYESIYSTPQAVLDEYNKTENLIKSAIEIPEYNSHLFRFPGGSHGGKYQEIKNQAIGLLKENNIDFINWNALTSDSAGANTKETIMQNLIDTVGDKTNVVILMHDAGDKILTYEVLPDIIHYLKEKGYTFKSFYSIMK